LKISVIGLGKLGSPMAACFASGGYDTIGVDIQEKVVQLVNEGKAPVRETGLDELFENNKGRLSATTDFNKAINETEVSFIIVPTPSDKNGKFSVKYVLQACQKIGKALSRKHDFHTIVITSTVMPGNTGGIIKETLEKHSGMVCGKHFGLCYNPDFIALGSVIYNFLNPDLILIGQSDKKAGGILDKIHMAICHNIPSIINTNFINAELAKIILNNYLTVKITFANMMAEICEEVPEGNSDVLTRVLGKDTRIGEKFLKGGLGFSGTCLPRDCRSLTYFLKTIGIEDTYPSTMTMLNNYQIKRIVERIEKIIEGVKGKKIAVLGLSYKPNTEVIEESHAIEIIKHLVAKGAIVSVYDPMAMEGVQEILGNRVKYAENASVCIANTEFCIIATAWEEFKKLTPSAFKYFMKKPVIFDCWRLYDNVEFKEHPSINSIDYHAIGVYKEK